MIVWYWKNLAVSVSFFRSRVRKMQKHTSRDSWGSSAGIYACVPAEQQAKAWTFQCLLFPQADPIPCTICDVKILPCLLHYRLVGARQCGCISSHLPSRDRQVAPFRSAATFSNALATWWWPASSRTSDMSPNHGHRLITLIRLVTMNEWMLPNQKMLDMFVWDL